MATKQEMDQTDSAWHAMKEHHNPKPRKSFTQTLRAGVRHKGGLGQLGHTEKMANLPPSIAAPADPSVPKTSAKAHLA